MNCPSCRHENLPSAKFCSECGTRLRASCPTCGVEVPPAAKFCSECGASLAAASSPASAPERPSLTTQFLSFQKDLPASFRDQLLTPAEGETRVVTVLFADMSRSVQTTGDLLPRIHAF
jgi:hypothetical protein